LATPSGTRSARWPTPWTRSTTPPTRPSSWAGPAGDTGARRPSEYQAFIEELDAIERGDAVQLTECHRCHKLVGVLDDKGVCYGFDRAASARVGYDGDPYTVLKLSCGHTQI